MVLAEKTNSEDARNGRRSRAASPNGHLSDDSSATDESDHDFGMRVGEDYQAMVPDLISTEACPEFVPERALLVWSPCADIPDIKLDDYITLSKEKYGYNAEQALGMLFWHKYDLEKAFADLPNFTPFPDEWTVEDKVLFEQAFQFHGKSFQKIRQMLPDKSIASLVKYYYSWKKTRCRTSLMDRQARKLAGHREDGSDAGSEAASENDSDFESENKDNKEEGKKPVCCNCSSPSSQLLPTPKGSLCNSCYQYWRRTGLMRSAGGVIKKHESTSARHNPIRSKRKPPRGMFLSYDDLVSIATGPPGQGDAILKAMDSEVVSLKRQVQNNKQMISQLKHKTSAGIDDYRPPEPNNRMNSRWTNDELLLAVQGVRKYGRDFKAIAELIGNKTEAHVRSFFVNYRRRYNLDAVLQEFEAEHGLTNEDDKDDKPIEVDLCTSNSSSGSGSHPCSPVPATTTGSSTTTTTSTSSTALQSSGPPPPPLLRPTLLPGSLSSHKPHPPPLQQATPRTSSGPRTLLQQPPPLIRPNTVVHKPAAAQGYA